MSVGIGIITCNRQWKLKECVTRLRMMTREPFDLMVADDGSTDGTLDYLREERIPVVTGRNRNVAWNKNRALQALGGRGHEMILLLEDDCFAVKPDWFEFWTQIVRRWGHVSYAGPWWPKELTLRGAGTVASPFFCGATTAQVSGFRSDVLAAVGFFDTRFRRFGHEHTEHSTRIIRAGYGGNQWQEDGKRRYDYLCANHGLDATNDASFDDKDGVRENETVFASIESEAVYRLYRKAWRDDSERIALQSEVAGITRYGSGD